MSHAERQLHAYGLGSGDGEAGRRGFVLRTGCSKIWIVSLLHGAGY